MDNNADNTAIMIAFSTDRGRTRNMRINNIQDRSILTASNNDIVREAVRDIMDSDALSGAGGTVNGFRRVFFETVNVETIQLPASS